MECERLLSLFSTTLSSPDGFGWKITAYEDTTVLEYWESPSDENDPTIVRRFELAAGYDLQIFTEAIRLRQAYNERNP